MNIAASLLVSESLHSYLKPLENFISKSGD